MSAKKSYSELLRDPRWQKKRLGVMQLAEFACEACGDTERTLNVHHKFYRKNAAPWEYRDHELQCLCEGCHRRVTGTNEALKEILGHLDEAGLDTLFGYAVGLVTVSRFEAARGFAGQPDLALPAPEASLGLMAALFPGHVFALDLIRPVVPVAAVYREWKQYKERGGLRMDGFDPEEQQAE